MAKVNELIYDVKERIKEFSDDTEFDNEYILYLYNIKRAKYLRQDLNNYQKTADNSILQSFNIGLEQVSADECDMEDMCETVMRSCKPIPTPIELHSRVALTRIKPTSRIALPFIFITKDRIPYISGSSFSNSIFVFLDDDNYLYFVSLSNSYNLLECVSVTGIFENPIDLTEFVTCCNCTEEETDACFDLNTSEYPLQPHYIDLIKNEIVQELLQSKQVPEDRENNSTDG